MASTASVLPTRSPTIQGPRTALMVLSAEHFRRVLYRSRPARANRQPFRLASTI